MSECAKCNGWGVDDVTGFACPSCLTVKQSLTVELVSNPDELAAAMQADAAPVAWLDRWARHIGDCPGIDDCTCGLTRVRYEARAALAGDSHE